MKKKYNITVLGMGSWGITLAILLNENGHNVKVWEYFEQRVVKIKKTRKFDLLPWIKIPKEVNLYSDINQACDGADFIVFAVPSIAVRNVAGMLKKNKISKEIISVVKGIEDKTFMRMSEVIADALGVSGKNIYVLSGPTHAEEVAKQIPTSIVLAGEKKNLEILQKIFANKYFRVYTSLDKRGVELGGSLKNIIAIAAGICDGLKLGDNAKAALMTRGLAEIVRFGVKQKASKNTFYGLSGIGDLMVTCMSQHSRNRHVGEFIGKGYSLDKILNEMNMVAEGVFAVKSMHGLLKKIDVDMPITNEVYKILYKNKKPDIAVYDLMTRRLKKEEDL